MEQKKQTYEKVPEKTRTTFTRIGGTQNNA